jgi:hypothetical protein
LLLLLLLLLLLWLLLLLLLLLWWWQDGAADSACGLARWCWWSWRCSGDGVARRCTCEDGQHVQ